MHGCAKKYQEMRSFTVSNSYSERSFENVNTIDYAGNDIFLKV